MHFSSNLLGVLALAASASAATNYLGFASGATKDDRTAKFKSDFVTEFTTAKNLQNSPGTFNAVRLYTNIQAYSQTFEPIEAFAAAVETKTFILLGIWASETTSITGEITALKAAVKTYGTKLTDLVIGMSVGSEDMYRDSPTGKANKAGPGASPEVILKFIKEYRAAFAGTALGSKPVGHVDTWDVWPNANVKAVIDAVDFIGVNEFPYYQTAQGNNITNSGNLFDEAYNTVLSVAGDKPIWITETGWPYVGEVWDEAEASISNAQYYWQEVGCRQLFGKVTTFWYTLRDSNPDNEMKFGITKDLSTTPRFDLTCPKVFQTKPKAVSSSVVSGSATATATGGSTATNSAGVTTAPTTEAAETSASTTPLAGSGAGSIKVFSGALYAISALCGGLFYFM